MEILFLILKLSIWCKDHFLSFLKPNLMQRFNLFQIEQAVLKVI
jgi:hypothetical protein